MLENGAIDYDIPSCVQAVFIGMKRVFEACKCLRKCPKTTCSHVMSLNEPFHSVLQKFGYEVSLISAPPHAPGTIPGGRDENANFRRTLC